ncbi:MAG: permease [Alphaproteobacteria bacterium]|nr:permease [Alphaproteobacteria bacterium]
MKKPLFARFQKDRRLGVSEGKRRYDLPLTSGAGTGFMVLLIGLMTFLAMMAIAAGFALNGMTRHWTSSLENTLTIEIPAARPNGKIRDSAEITALARSVAQTLKNNPHIENLEVLEAEQISDLLAPWLGKDVTLNDMPLPGLISVHLYDSEPETLKALTSAVESVAADIRIDAHERWLGDILRLVRTLELSAGLVTLIIMITTVTAIMGAVRSRMAEHKDDIELLHMMGASDMYVMRQFRRHALILSFKGALGGVTFGTLTLAGMALLNRSAAQSLLPDFSLSGLQVLGLLSLPLAVCFIAAMTSRFTVLRVLSRMP